MINPAPLGSAVLTGTGQIPDAVPVNHRHVASGPCRHTALVLALSGFLLSGGTQENSLHAAAADPAPSASMQFDVRAFGATGNGEAFDTEAINRAIERCAAAGGGQVLFPPGRYLSGTVQLRSHVSLFLAAGATLVGTTNLEAYQHFSPPAGTAEARFRSQWHRALLLGDGLEEVAILGSGMIDGNRVFDPRGEERMRGPHTILLGNSKRFTVRDVSIRDSANYAVMLEDCDEVEIRNVQITGGWDGVHFRGWPGRPCRDVRIVNCQFYTGDDAIAGRYWENVLISGCIVNSSCNGIRVIGPVQHLTIHNCLFYGPGIHPHRTSNRYNMLAAICLQPGAWDRTEGLTDDVLISDITAHNVTTPFHFSTKPGNQVGRVTVNRVAATGVYRAACSVESWAETPFTNVVFRDVSVEFTGGVGLEGGRSTVRAPGVDARPLPAWGFFARNVENLTFDQVRLRYVANDLRPVMIAENVQRFASEGFKFPQAPGGMDALVLTNVGTIDLQESSAGLVEPVYLEAEVGFATNAGAATASEPFTLRVRVQGVEIPGLGQIKATVAGQALTRWLWLRPKETREVVFPGLQVAEPGSYEVRAGNLSRTFRVAASKP